MSDEKNVPVNPFDDANFASGGGLWDGKTVTITNVKAVIDRITNADGSAYLNDKGEPATQNVLAIQGLADDEDTERRQTYSSGALVPTPDGDGFVKADGTPGVFHKNSKAAAFFSAVKAAGFDLNRLFVNGKPTLQGLVGARFTFVGQDRIGKDGAVKKNKKGYVVQDFFPVKFLGFAEGKAVASPASADAARTKAREIVTGLLADAGGKLTRAEMLRKVAGKVIGQPDGNVILGMIAKDEFHSGAPWAWDGSTLTL